MLRRLVLIAAALTACSPEAARAPEFHPAAGREVCQGHDGYASTFDGRRTFLWRADWLKHIKQEVTQARSPAFEQLIRNADNALKHGPYTVIQKTVVPSSGDKHDYFSLATYWWPDPEKPDGLPYIRRDGEINPEVYSKKFDFANLQDMSADVTALSLAYYFTDDDLYARHAVGMLRTWFLEPDTRMNPNLIFAQGVPGRSEGRPTGIIETIDLIPVTESIGLLQASDALSPDDLNRLQAWFKDYVEWLHSSEAGEKEAESTNNHSVAYDLQLISFALFSGQIEIAWEVAGDFAERRIVPQVSSDGSMPQELARARTFHYSLFTLGLMAEVASLSECVGLDLWRFKEPDGGGIRAAFDFVAPYAGREKDWPHAEAGDATEWHRYQIEFHDLLLQAAWAYNEPSYAAKAAHYESVLKEGTGNIVLPGFGG